MVMDFFLNFPKVSLGFPNRLLVTGCGRSGTTALASLLNSHPRIGVLTEFGWAGILDTTDVFFKAHDEAVRRLNLPAEALTLRQYVDPLDTLDDAEAVCDSLALPLDQVTGPMIDDLAARMPAFTVPSPALHRDRVIAALFSAVFSDKVLSVVGDKTPDVFKWEGHVSNLIERLPGLKILYIFRDPKAVVASSLKRRDATLEGADDWHVTTVEHAYGEWRNDVRMALKFAEADPETIHFVHYDDLLDPDRFAEVSAGLAAFLGVQNGFVNNFGPRPPRPFSQPDEQAFADYAFPKVAGGDAMSPRDLLATLAARKAPLKTGRPVEMSSIDSSAIDLSGFGAHEPTGRWTVEAVATADWVVYGAPCSGIRLEIAPRHIAGGSPTALTIEFGGIKTTRLLPQSEDWSNTYDIELRLGREIPIGETLSLTLEVTNPKTRQEQPVADDRALGVRLIRFTPLA